jgi:hypothetical protein
MTSKASEEQPRYHPKDALAAATNYALLTGGAGAAIAGIQNTLTRQNFGAMGFLTRFGGTTAIFGTQLARLGSSE